MVIQQLEYRGLNLHDVIGSVEIAIDVDLNTIHIYDTDHIVEPEYDFLTKNFKLSEGFWKMANVIKEKQLFLSNDEKNLDVWIESFNWFFYSSGPSVKIYKQGEMVVFKNDYINIEKLLYEKYFSRLTGESLNGK
ncbi:aminopeptidase [Solibacillus sp. FSL W7-1472]|uniref:aminopeptidase n=1 Tax=Solibacillus sp. FSL W7-1472 TaxID=2921707 RepID=UPI0007FB27D5|nr:aminopeptidase [Solibacillus silvestris]OBW60002.1 aminopeptidase [Solibacillus silvestris]